MRTAARWAPGSKWGLVGARAGKRQDLGIYVRSSWEANYARYLNWMKSRGEILGWEYEKQTFGFPVKRGTMSYTPDFKVSMPDGSIEFHEVKGYDYPKGITARKRMAIYHPEVKLILIAKQEYTQIQKQLSTLIEGWE